MTPVTRMVDVESLFAAIEQMSNKLKKGGTINKYATLLEGVKETPCIVQER